MALTRTRTRRQTTLTKLAQLTANLHSELAFAESLLAAPDTRPDERALIAAHHTQLARHRDALHATIRQFDPSLDPSSIGAVGHWQRRLGQMGLSPKTLKVRLLKELAAAAGHS